MNLKFSSAFTLIEIMVALTIIAITLGVIIENTTVTTKNTQYLRDKSIAQWIAMNQISLYRAKRQWSNVSNKKGHTTMANRDWLWKMKIAKTDEPDLRRLTVDVYLQESDDHSLVTMTGFVGKL